MEPREKKRMLLLVAGIGFVAIGIASIFMIYMFVYQPTTVGETASGDEQEFNLAEIHSVPLARHDHVVMSILVNGRPAMIPEGVGMDPDLWHDHSLDRFGPSGISPLHTHDTSGTIHIESTSQREFTVGEFLGVMGLDSGAVERMTVDGSEVDDPMNHEMKRGEQIQLEMTITAQ
jgi:hypothetical protein